LLVIRGRGGKGYFSAKKSERVRFSPYGLGPHTLPDIHHEL